MQRAVHHDDRPSRSNASEAVVSDLKGRVRGPLLRPGRSGIRRGALGLERDDRPAAGAHRCAASASTDVVACVNAARERGLPLSIKGGGHNIAGLAVCDGGLMLDMSLMRGVWVDPAARVARAQAGCLLGDVDAETQVHGLAAVLGFVSATGCAGLTLGGGFGYLTRRFGWTTDNLASVDLVTADGRVVRASERENSDLFWGLRGGGGNFGVATSFEYTLHPVGPDDRRRRHRLARRGGRRRARDVSIARGQGTPRADLRRRAAPRAPGAVDRQGRARQADRRALRLLFRTARRRPSACSRRSSPSARRSATSCRSGRTSRSRCCSTPRSRRAAATTGSPSTCGRSSRTSSRGPSSTRPASCRRIRRS